MSTLWLSKTTWIPLHSCLRQGIQSQLTFYNVYAFFLLSEWHVLVTCGCIPQQELLPHKIPGFPRGRQLLHSAGAAELAGSAAASRMQQGACCCDRQSALQQKMGAAPSWGILAPFPPVWGNRTHIWLSSVNGRKLLSCMGQLASLQGRSSQFSCASCSTFPTLSSVGLP